MSFSIDRLTLEMRKSAWYSPECSACSEKAAESSLLAYRLARLSRRRVYNDAAVDLQPDTDSPQKQQEKICPESEHRFRPALSLTVLGSQQSHVVC